MKTEAGAGAQKKVPLTGRTLNDGSTQLCKPSQDSRGCTVSGCKKPHVCDVLIGSDKICGSKAHTRSQHAGLGLTVQGYVR